MNVVLLILDALRLDYVNPEITPNLMRIAGVEFEVGELVMSIMMAAGAVILGAAVFTTNKRLYSRYKQRIGDSSSVAELCFGTNNTFSRYRKTGNYINTYT